MPDVDMRELLTKLDAISQRLYGVESRIRSELGDSQTPGNVPRLLNEIKEQIAALKKETDEIDTFLLGDTRGAIGFASRLIHLEDAEKTRKIHDVSFHGDGSHLGVFTRLDRLEQAEASRTRQIWALTTAVITALVGLAFSALKGG